MKKIFTLIAALLLITAANGQFQHSGGIPLRTGSSFMTASEPAGPPPFDGGIINNGDFSDGDTYWTVDANWSIADGKATFSDAASGDLLQAVADMVTPLATSTTYEFSFDITLGTATSINISIRDDADNDLSGTLNYTSDGTKTGTFTTVGWGAATKGFKIAASSSSNGTFSIDNISVNVQ